MSTCRAQRQQLASRSGGGVHCCSPLTLFIHQPPPSWPAFACRPCHPSPLLHDFKDPSSPFTSLESRPPHSTSFPTPAGRRGVTAGRTRSWHGPGAPQSTAAPQAALRDVNRPRRLAHRLGNTSMGGRGGQRSQGVSSSVCDCRGGPPLSALRDVNRPRNLACHLGNSSMGGQQGPQP